MAVAGNIRGTPVAGIETVAANINKELAKMVIRSVNGYRRVAVFLFREMNTTPPVIPVDTGNLRGSWFQEFVNDLKTGNPAMIFGFGANYALYVHERVGGAPWGNSTVGEINWKRKGSGPKFFEAALKRNQKQILFLLQQEIKI